MSDKPGRHRNCWNCGADMGWIANRYYSRRDTCGAAECEREARETERAEREEAHRELDERNGW